jgi:hypothetical protein
MLTSLWSSRFRHDESLTNMCESTFLHTEFFKNFFKSFGKWSTSLSKPRLPRDLSTMLFSKNCKQIRWFSLRRYEKNHAVYLHEK